MKWLILQRRVDFILKQENIYNKRKINVKEMDKNMSEILTVHDENNQKLYDIIIEGSFNNLSTQLEALDLTNKRVCIVTDSKVEKLYGDTILDIVSKISKEAYIFSFPAGEANKNLYTVKDVYTFLIEKHFDRKDMLIALGGGVVGDLTGFTAATYLRGIDFVQIPTTLLSQSDSSVGGKTGVDFDGYKNMVGAFYQPKLVYMNTSTFKTLTKKEYLSGMGEVIKHGLIKDKAFYQWIKDNASGIKAFDEDVLLYMVKRNCEIKRDVVENDFKELGERALLNFGHTLGHAIEKFVYSDRLHGECVSVGFVGAAFISMKKGYISKEEYNDILSTLKLFELPVYENRIDIDDVLAATVSDKKMEAGKIKFIILSSIGNAIMDKSIDLIDMKEALGVIIDEK